MQIDDEDAPEINTLEDFVGELVWRKNSIGTREGPFLVVRELEAGKVAQLAWMRSGALTLPGTNDVFILDTQHRLVYRKD